MDDLTFIIVDMNDSVQPTFLPDDRRFVYGIARRFVGPADADDVTQDALLLAFRHRTAFRGEARYRTWLYRIAATTALGHLRRHRRSRIQAVGGEPALERTVDPARSPEALVIDAEVRDALVRALGELPASYRQILLERSESGEREVARRLGITVGNVKVRAHRARHRLRETFDRIESAA
jgi:RNA polymerase sigma-70 factor (ECF subfamily)